MEISSAPYGVVELVVVLEPGVDASPALEGMELDVLVDVESGTVVELGVAGEVEEDVLAKGMVVEVELEVVVVVVVGVSGETQLAGGADGPV